MSEKKSHIDQIARNKLLEAKVEPPLTAWSDLVIGLDKIRSKKKIVLFKKLSAAAAIIIVLIALGLNYFAPINTDEVIAETKLTIDSTQKPLPKVDSIEPKPIITHKPQLSSTRTIVHTQTAIQPIETFKQKFYLAYMKTLGFALPINSIHHSNNLIANNNIVKKRNTITDQINYEFTQKQVIPKNKNWKLGLDFSPTYSTINAPKEDNCLRANDALGGLNNENSSLNVNERLIPSLTFGLNFSYNISDRWSIISGINYFNQKNEIQNFYVLENTANALSEYSTNSSLGNIQLSNNNELIKAAEFSDYIALSTYANLSNSNSNLIQSFEFIEIPLLISFKLVDNNYSISLIGGFNTGFLVGNNVYLKNQESINIGTTEDINNIMFKSVIGFAFEYPLAKHLYLTVAPTYKYQLNELNKASVLNYHLHFFDVKTGISYQF